MAAIQFFGRTAVLDAAANRNCPKWALFQGTQFLVKCDDPSTEYSLDLLDKVLKSFVQSSAIYSLRFYEDDVKIKATTPYDGSFNFKLIEESERSVQYQALMQRIEDLEAEKQQDEPAGGIVGRIFNGIADNIINDPTALEKYILIGKNLLGIRPTTGSKIISGAGPPNDESEKILQAINLLKVADPAIADHLLKLAEISKSDPDTFKMLIGMLDKM